MIIKKPEIKQSEWWCWLKYEEDMLKHGEPVTKIGARKNEDLNITPEFAAKEYARYRYEQEEWEDSTTVCVTNNIGLQSESDLGKEWYEFDIVRGFDWVETSYLGKFNSLGEIK